MKVKYKKIANINEFIDAIRLRVDVFIKEQGFDPGWEPDEDDKKSTHVIAVVDGKVVATARYRALDEKIKIERMVVSKDFRGEGVGFGLVNFMIQEIKRKEHKKIWMQSQLQAKKFYEKCGFKAISKPYKLWGVKHIDMEY